MATLLFRLNNVPDEEADEVRALLDDHGFDTYETRAGFWGLGVAAIWLQDDKQLASARQVIDQYQQALGERVRREHDDLAAKGQAPSLWRRLRHHPLRVLFFTTVAAVVLALSLLPFVWLID
ncbi:hypothetical protein KG088_07290 [Halomonas sp. TRM85114]|uniref:DUF6164 family protein n=1 Tax=Halomonas jincaotanensis TaxID=2810616 RepID=UPI001BD42FF5|nr:DUF6164 family protein [Halomonas jincaotanensis]MBS9403428.1 hypothetical protein [Halomonas jincaotanensis]